ncbi:hypothetical protein ABND49_17720 [Paenibacillus larvae]
MKNESEDLKMNQVKNQRLKELLEKIEITDITYRDDQLDDLRDGNSFVNKIGFKNIGEMIAIVGCDIGLVKQRFIYRAISKRKTEIASEFVKVLQDEDITIFEATSILNKAIEKIYDSKFVS